MTKRTSMLVRHRWGYESFALENPCGVLIQEGRRYVKFRKHLYRPDGKCRRCGDSRDGDA